MAGGGGHKKRFSIVLILQEQFCTSELSKVTQDVILLIIHYKTMSIFRTVSSSTFIMSDVQSIYIPSSDPMDKEHKYPDTIDMEAPRLAQYMHKASKHCVLGRPQSCSEERIEVLSGTIERYHSSRNSPSLLYPESCSDGTWISHFRESICVTSASSQDLLET